MFPKLQIIGCFPELTLRQVLVWDIATRLFHWLLVLFVVICFVTGEDEGLQFAIHAYAGFVVLMLLVFRLGWGVIGSRHSRFADFIYPWPIVRRYALSLLRFRTEHYAGHNPLGGWMVILMLAVLMAAALSGFLMVAPGAKWLEDIHEALGSFMQILVLIHISGVVVDQVLTRENLIQAMFTGRKELTEDTANAESFPASIWWALFLAALVVIGSIYLFQQTGYAAKVSAF
jgi:cytochrome b